MKRPIILLKIASFSINWIGINNYSTNETATQLLLKKAISFVLLGGK